MKELANKKEIDKPNVAKFIEKLKHLENPLINDLLIRKVN